MYVLKIQSSQKNWAIYFSVQCICTNAIYISAYPIPPRPGLIKANNAPGFKGCLRSSSYFYGVEGHNGHIQQSEGFVISWRDVSTANTELLSTLVGGQTRTFACPFFSRRYVAFCSQLIIRKLWNPLGII